MRPWSRGNIANYAWIALAVAALVAIIFVLSNRFPDIRPENSAQTAAGARIFLSFCAGCHGRNLQGEPGWPNRKPNGHLPAPPLNASGHSWVHEDSELVDIIRNGQTNSDMPGFSGALSNDDIAGVIAFIKTMWPAEERAHQEHLSGEK